MFSHVSHRTRVSSVGRPCTGPDLKVVAEAADGAQALELCRQFCPDLVLMNMRMPQVVLLLEVSVDTALRNTNASISPA